MRQLNATLLGRFVNGGGVLLFALGVAYLVIGLAILNDYYFMAALGALSRRLNLSDDVAGASLYAAGSSAPVLFFGFFSLLAPSSAIPNAVGISAITGSANANVLAVIGFSVIYAGQTLPLQWLPALRDVVFLAATIAALAGTVADGTVHWWEGLIMVLIYVLYIVYMTFNARIVEAVDSALQRRKDARRAASAPKFPFPIVSATQPPEMNDSALDMRGATPGSAQVQQSPEQQSPSSPRSDTYADEAEADDAVYASSCLRPPAGAWQRLWWLICLPWYVALAATVPDCRRPFFKHWYVLSLLVCLAWIGGASWFILIWAINVGCVIHMPLPVMGTTVLALGSTVMTALVSAFSARKGHGDLAVSNAVGSSVFNILVGLGLPYCIVLSAKHSTVQIETGDLWANIGLLIGPLVAYVLVLLVGRWRLTKVSGWVLLGLYASYVLWEGLTKWAFDLYGMREG